MIASMIYYQFIERQLSILSFEFDFLSLCRYAAFFKVQDFGNF